jgi:tRNA(Ile)-lysidine synthase
MKQSLSSALSDLDKTKTYALACSGGVDSMVLFDLLLKKNFHFCVIHCNFQLRKPYCDEEEMSLQAICESFKIPFFSDRFDTSLESKKRKESIEMVARELRYDFFKSIKEKWQYDFLLTAHHQNDAAETQLLRIIKGTSIDGLKGIAFQNNNIIRPLISSNKKEILDYAVRNNIKYFQDESNFENVYQRNKIRNQIIPIIEEINPNFLEAFEKLSLNAVLYQDVLNEITSSLVFDFEKNETIDLNSYKDKSYLSLIVYEILKKYKPTNDQILKLSKALFSTEKKQFFIDKHAYYVKNGILEREMVFQNVNFDIQVEDINKYFECFTIEQCTEINNFENGNIYIDFFTFNFPLKIKNVSFDQKVKPLGASSFKSIAQILKNYKLSDIQKKNLLSIEDAQSKFIGVLGLFQTELSRINNNKGNFIVISPKQYPNK